MENVFFFPGEAKKGGEGEKVCFLLFPLELCCHQLLEEGRFRS